MDFGFSEEQEMLRDAAKRFLADNCPTTFVRKMMAHDTAHDADFYKKLVESRMARTAGSRTIRRHRRNLPGPHRDHGRSRQGIASRSVFRHRAVGRRR